tara:strand:+ start:1657 stop:1815 length:159 start_codon:yes stop_codon:yes gene_type:complete
MTDVYKYLDDLRDSGVTNMYGAGQYLQQEFGMDKYEAREVLANWMRSKRDEE